MEYMKLFNKFVLATSIGGAHTEGHQDCEACSKTKATLELVGGKEMCVLFEHTGE